MLSICPQRRGKAGEYRALPNSVSHKFMASNYSVSAICGCQTFYPQLVIRFQWLFLATNSMENVVLGLFLGGYFHKCVLLMFRLLAHDHCSSDNVSLASDLTRMYVSDEDDRLERTEFRVPHYH